MTPKVRIAVTSIVVGLVLSVAPGSACGWNQNGCYIQHDRNNVGYIIGCRSFSGNSYSGVLTFKDWTNGYSYVVITNKHPNNYAKWSPADFRRLGYPVAPQPVLQSPPALGSGRGYGSGLCDRQAYNKCMDDARDMTSMVMKQSMMSTCQSYISGC